MCRESAAGCCVDWGCCCPGPLFPRRFFSAKEKREMLKEYEEQLKKELEGVEERLEELESD